MNEAPPSKYSSELLRYGIFIAVAAIAVLFMWFGMDTLEQYLKPEDQAANLKTGTLLPTPKPLKAINLIDQDNKPLTIESFKGQWTFLAIGYTACPDVCPTLMATFRFIDQILRSKGITSNVNFIFVSVDPERDKPENIGRYVHSFNPKFIGATGEPLALRTLTSQLGLMYQKATGQNSAMGYLIDHSASIVLIDPNGSWKAVFTPPHDPDTVAFDFMTIKAQYPTL